MFDSRKQNPNCNFGEEVVSYIYDEMQTVKKTTFEKHMSSCPNCADEVAAFSSVSFSIRDWRDTEFGTLETPEIVIPYETAKDSAKTVEVRSGSRSWIDNLRELFNFSPVFLKAVTAFGAIAITIGLGWFLLSTVSDKNANLAEDSQKEQENENVPSPIIKEIEQTNSPEVADVNNNVADKIEKGEESVKEVAVQTPIPTKIKANNKKTVTETRQPPAKQITRKQKPKSAIDKQDKELNQPQPKKIEIQEVPRLTDFAIEDVEEDDLRLSDLFTEVGTD